MQSAWHISTKVLPGNKIEILIPQLPVGDAVEVFVILPENPTPSCQSAIELLDKLPGQRLFKTSAEVDQYLEEEHNTWES